MIMHVHLRLSAVSPATWARIGAVVVSGAILWAVFPPARMGTDGAWFALAPLLLVARHTEPRRAFWLGGLGGAVFWLLSLTWIWRLIANQGPWPLVILGYLALSAYCALYFALFTLASARVWQQVRRRENIGTRLLAVVLAEPLLWVGAEYLRGALLTGFPWNAVGVTQQGVLPVLQLASLGGVLAVSLAVLLVNGAVAGMCERAWGAVRTRTYGDALPGGRWRALETVAPMLLLMSAWMWGLERARQWDRQSRGEPRFQVAMVQPNAPSIFERDDENQVRTRRILLEQTSLAADTLPDLMVWPETALMSPVPVAPAALALASNGAVRARAPLLTGAVEVQLGPTLRHEDARFFNSAWLFTSGGLSAGRYRKQHLVPFGEFIPGDCVWPWLARFSPVGFSCTAGRESTVLYVVGRTRADGSSPGELAFSPLICFEDTVAGLARRAVKRGARLLVNLTNDAWFGGSCEPEQHLAQALFRCVETGVPMVRAANTGVTCAIDPLGRRSCLTSEGRRSDFAGFHSVSLAVPQTPFPTLYLRWGDWLLGRPAAALLLAVLFAPWAVAARRARR